jgi:hypothetical protein
MVGAAAIGWPPSHAVNKEGIFKDPGSFHPGPVN